jgi:hypothetical protein
MNPGRNLPVKMILIMLLIHLQVSFSAFSQGRVVINEFMPWTSNTCGGPTAEFVELLNFGPGPVNIGCYILTDGDFSVTIPANTILQPGEFFVISGQNVIAGPCANIDSTITVDLNWNTCNCTSGVIPGTGDGWFTDGGSANEQVVLLSPTLSIVDAVVRSLPVEPSALITTSTAGGQCASGTFDLDLMAINYETIGESAGRGNSFARRLDGDCGWVKDPQQSANATNNTPGESSDVDYDFAVINASTCSNTGTVDVIVNASSYTNIFPLNYTLAFDTDYDYVFELTDQYSNGTDNTPNTLTVSDLIAGNYRLTVGSTLGCNLQTFPFTILSCGTVLTQNGTSPNLPGTNTSIPPDKIWPNPVKDQLFTQLYFERAEMINYLVFNVSNQLVATGYKTVTKGINRFSIPVSHLATGTYQLRIREKGPMKERNSTLRFIKL